MKCLKPGSYIFQVLATNDAGSSVLSVSDQFTIPLYDMDEYNCSAIKAQGKIIYFFYFRSNTLNPEMRQLCVSVSCIPSDYWPDIPANHQFASQIVGINW